MAGAAQMRDALAHLREAAHNAHRNYTDAAQRKDRVDSRFSILDGTQADLLNEILSRRNPALHDRLRGADSVSHSNADNIMSILSDELTDNLDDEWEPTEYGRTVSALLATFNEARVSEWPE